jgi:hypothetical protein
MTRHWSHLSGLCERREMNLTASCAVEGHRPGGTRMKTECQNEMIAFYYGKIDLKIKHTLCRSKFHR